MYKNIFQSANYFDLVSLLDIHLLLNERIHGASIKTNKHKR